MQPITSFDFNNISAEQQSACEVIIAQLQASGELTPETEQRLKKQFGLLPREETSYKESKIYNLANKFGIFASEEGFLTKENGDRISVIKIVADIEKLDAFLEYSRIVLNDWEKEKEEEHAQEEKNITDKVNQQREENSKDNPITKPSEEEKKKFEEDYLNDLLENIDV
jgi:hypothetical protein